MGCGKKTDGSFHHLVSTLTSTWKFEPTTDWMVACGIDNIKMGLKLDNSSQMRAQGAYQTAAVRTDVPNAWANNAKATRTSDGETCSGNDPDFWDTTAPNFYVRFGIAYQVVTGSVATGDVALEVEFEQCGRLVGSRKIDVNIGTSGNYDEPVTAWMPANTAQIAKYALLMTDASTYLRCQPTFQIATTSVESPGAWTTFGAAVSRTGSNTEACTGEIQPTGTTAAMWIRFGLRISASSGSVASGVISAVVAAKPA